MSRKESQSSGSVATRGLPAVKGIPSVQGLFHRCPCRGFTPDSAFYSLTFAPQNGRGHFRRTPNQHKVRL